MFGNYITVVTPVHVSVLVYPIVYCTLLLNDMYLLYKRYNNTIIHRKYVNTIHDIAKELYVIHTYCIDADIRVYVTFPLLYMAYSVK